MTDRELMHQALDALENIVDLVREDAYNAEELYGNYPTRQGKVGGLKVLADDHEKAITALRDRLAKPEQEPVMFLNNQPLYTNPRRPWVGLTEEDKEEILGRKWWNFEDEFDLAGFLGLAETKLKEKNGG